MSWRSLLAAQSRRPSGLIGRLFMGPYLDRANRRINDLVYAALAPPARAQVLEIGFGGGDLLIRVAADLEQGRIDGIEPSAEMLAVARRRADKTAWAGRIELHRAGVDKLPFAAERFDLVYSVHSIYFWADLASGLAEIARVLKPGGRLVLGFSSVDALRAEGWHERGFRLYDNADIVATGRRQGLLPAGETSARRSGGGRLIALSAVKA